MGLSNMKNLDYPPVWLALFIIATWILDRLIGFDLFGGAGQRVGAGLILAGFVLMGLAVWTMMRSRTTVIPRKAPTALVTDGIFRFSRNPIYLGDVLVLAGVILWWDVPVALPLVFGFMAIIQHRFIAGEEAALKAAFPEEFTAWSSAVRRWV